MIVMHNTIQLQIIVSINSMICLNFICPSIENKEIFQKNKSTFTKNIKKILHIKIFNKINPKRNNQNHT